MGPTTFQLYLLSRMRAEHAVKDALTKLGLTREDLERAAEEAGRYGFEETIHDAALYEAALGPPRLTKPVRDLDAASPFAGSTALHFALPLWPGFDFVVRRHPTGYAWGMGFARGEHEVPPPNSAEDLKPWAFVEAEVTERFGKPTSADAWSGWEDLCYTIPDATGVRPYLLQFDLNLLQKASPFDG